MSVKAGLSSIGLIGLSLVVSGQAAAFCAHDTMGEAAASAFTAAEAKFFSGARSFEVLMTLAPMKQMPLNCFEAGRMQLLIAGVYMRDEDNRAAAEAFEAALAEDFLEKPARRDVLKALGNLYLGFDDAKALSTFDAWIETGVHPAVEDELMIAELHLKAGQLDKAFTHAESAYRESTTPEQKSRADAIMTEAQKRRLGQ